MVVRMTLRLWTIEVDAHDPQALGRWWAEALGWKVFYDSDDEFVITTDDERFPGLVFSRVPESKSVKNRLHLDFAPDDRDAEVERLTGLGATRADIGQKGDEGWVVLADPEGNEFCVLSAREGGM
jgi:predicted enzyme related to lactoylglutathione lyase